MFTKHSKSFSLIDSLATGWIGCCVTLGRCKRKRARGAWQRRELTDVTAEVDSLRVGDQPGTAPFVNASAFVGADPGKLPHKPTYTFRLIRSWSTVWGARNLSFISTDPTDERTISGLSRYTLAQSENRGMNWSLNSLGESHASAALSKTGVRTHSQLVRIVLEQHRDQP